ncbi:uncharacterized protein BDV14DRAFT_138849 [Aspergillus stella-maris]|uniref:uncharacterized protein n=1 Tax=Aspergillus stella-maris TaxID=1810926 RepID=UPI003CCD8295
MLISKMSELGLAITCLTNPNSSTGIKLAILAGESPVTSIRNLHPNHPDWEVRFTYAVVRTENASGVGKIAVLRGSRMPRTPRRTIRHVVFRFYFCKCESRSYAWFAEPKVATSSSMGKVVDNPVSSSGMVLNPGLSSPQVVLVSPQRGDSVVHAWITLGLTE